MVQNHQEYRLIGYSLIYLLVCSHCSLVRFLAHSVAHSLILSQACEEVNDEMVIFAVFFLVWTKVGWVVGGVTIDLGVS